MSDQGYTAAEDENGEDGGIFCQNCSPTTRKIGYYLTILAGIVLYVFGIFNLLTLQVVFLVAGSLFLILAPLWVKSPKALFQDLKNPLRLTSFLIFLACLVATIIVWLIVKNTILTVICGVLLALSGIWYFLSFFQNGQKACIACIKSCFGKAHNIYSLTMNTRNRNIRLIRNVVADSKKMERSIEKLLRNHAANDIDKKDNFCINFINPNFNYIKCKFIIL